MNNALKSKKQPWLVAVFFIAVAVFCYRMPLLIAGTFGDISVEQLLFHLNTRTEGMPSSFIKDSLRELFFKPLIAAFLVYLILTKLPSKLQT
ncbi:MAG: hypothetical protein Q8J76_01955, partial [Desulfobulbaceae bacterium]|nr:hypothetical protein [Desulfobulbaceae bacterium]